MADAPHIEPVTEEEKSDLAERAAGRIGKAVRRCPGRNSSPRRQADEKCRPDRIEKKARCVPITITRPTGIIAM